MRPAFKFDTAAAISKGGRDYQEDALITDFMSGADVSIAVLADGMGGHAAGDVASKVVVTEVFRELIFRRDAIANGSAKPAEVLQAAALSANDCLSRLVAEKPERHGMGATLLGLMIQNDALSWISVGDSPLFLFRDNKLHQLNEDHSLASHINFLVESGALTAEEGADHPERNVLTSVLSGEKIAHIDCPKTPIALQPGDVLIAASDGLQFLSDDEIAKIIRGLPLGRSSEISDALMDALKALDDPDLDNVTLLAVQVRLAAPARDIKVLQSAANDDGQKPGRWPFARPAGKIVPRRVAEMRPR